ncbi:MAG: FlgD immunoglobulin-like domain containing protein [Candidatus Krumholzibacteriia bacterium]
MRYAVIFCVVFGLSGTALAQTGPCSAIVSNGWSVSAVTVAVDGHSYLLEIGQQVEITLEGPEELCIWECVDPHGCRWDCAYTICPGGIYSVHQVGDPYDLTLVVDSPGNCSDASVEVSVPPCPYQTIYRTSGPDGEEVVIELRNENLPQGLFLGFSEVPPCICGGESPQAVDLALRSLTGPVFSISGAQTYFLIDNLTSEGYYDIRVTCPDLSERWLTANVHYVGYQGYQPSGWLVNEVTGNAIRGAGVSIWQQDDQGGFNVYDSMIASDGTYFFDVPAGVYRILVEYDLDGEYWTDPFTVNSPIPSNIVPPLPPMSDDTAAPEITVTSPEPGVVAGSAQDAGVGIALLEADAGSLQNVEMAVASFSFGDAQVIFQASLQDPESPGAVVVMTMDLLGNWVRQEIGIDPVTTGIGGDMTPSAPLLRVTPNPTNPRATIYLSLVGAGRIELTVHDVAGKQVAQLANGFFTAGNHRIVWDGLDDSGRRLASGTYLVNLRCSGSVETTKVTIVR